MQSQNKNIRFIMRIKRLEKLKQIKKLEKALFLKSKRKKKSFIEIVNSSYYVAFRKHYNISPKFKEFEKNKKYLYPKIKKNKMKKRNWRYIKHISDQKVELENSRRHFIEDILKEIYAIKKDKKLLKREIKKKSFKGLRLSYSFMYIKLLRKFMKCGKLENIRRKIQDAISIFCFLRTMTFEHFTRLFFLLALKLTINGGRKPVRRGRHIIMKAEAGTARRGLIIGLDIFLQGVIQRRKRKKYLSFEYFFLHELMLGLGGGIKKMKSAEIVGDYFKKLQSLRTKRRRRKFRYGKAFSKAARMYAAETIRQAF